MAKKRQLAKELEDELLSQMSEVKADMTDKIETQRTRNKKDCDSLLADMNAKVSESEVELRQRWRELAASKTSLTEAREKRDNTRSNVTRNQSRIDAYESDRNSVRASLRLTARLARKKVGSKTKRLLDKVRKKTR